MDAAIRPRLRILLMAVGLGFATLLAGPPAASAGVNGQCPAVADKPDAIPRVEYQGTQ